MPRFAPGDRVTVLDLGKVGHVRIPFFVRLKTGTVERYCGAYPNPEELAFGADGLPEVDLYRVHFPLDNLWPVYAGERFDSLEIEVYDHWLAPAEEGVR
jgi:nitrile hydratase subunit beta